MSNADKMAVQILYALCGSCMCDLRYNVIFNTGGCEKKLASFDAAAKVIEDTIQDTFLTNSDNLKAVILRKLKEVKNDPS